MVTRASDNPFPSVLFRETVDPANPAAGDQRLFVDTDHLLKLRDSAGTVTTFGPSGMSDPMTTRGDMIVRNASNVTARLGRGTAGQVLTSDGTDLAWATPSAGFADPMTTRGDMIIRNASNATARLGKGSASQVLTSDGTDIAWATPASSVNQAHGCRVQRASGNVSVGNNTYTVIPFTTESYDTDSMHDNSTNPSRLIVPTISGVTTGLWAVSGRGYTTSTTSRVDSQLRLNAAGSNAGGTLIGTTIGVAIAASGVGAFAFYEEVVLTAADYVELFVRTTSGSFSVVFEADDSPIMAMSFLGKVT
jgi:hypothetical protein